MKFFLAFILLFLATTAIATEYCKPDGGGGVEVCFSTSDATKITKALAKGYVQVINTNDDYDSSTLDVVSITYDSTVSPITKTWNTEAKTAEELNQYKSSALSVEMYAVLKWLKTPAAIVCDTDLTDCHVNPLTAPQPLKDAYLARQALGQ